MADESVVESPVKRQRDDEENGASVSMDTDGGKDPQPNGLSSVIPGWFSEISSMWPGLFSFYHTLLFVAFKSCAFSLFCYWERNFILFKLLVCACRKVNMCCINLFMGSFSKEIWI